MARMKQLQEAIAPVLQQIQANPQMQPPPQVQQIQQQAADLQDK